MRDRHNMNKAHLKQSLAILLIVGSSVALAQGSYDLGNRLFASGDYSGARDAYKAAVYETDSNTAAHARYMLAQCFERMRDWSNAESNYRLVWQLNSRSSWADDALLRVAIHLSVASDKDSLVAATKLCERLLRLYPDSDSRSECLCLLGETKIRLGKYEEALNHLLEVVQAGPGGKLTDRAHFALGKLYSADGNPAKDMGKAQEEFKLVFEENPDSSYAPWAYFSVGNILRDQQKWEDAKPYFKTVLERYPGTFCAAATAPILALSRVEQDSFLRGRESFEDLLAIVHKDRQPEPVEHSAEPQVVRLEVIADETYSDNRRAIYKGNVTVSAGALRIFADQVVCDLGTYVFRSSGQTRLQIQKEFALDCRQLKFDVKTQRGVASGGVSFVTKLPQQGSSGPKIKTVKKLVFRVRDNRLIPVSEQE